MIDIPTEALIQCSAEQAFDLIADFRGQDRWLAHSSAFRGTTDISSDPVTLGTTYREPGPFGVRNGRVSEFKRPTTITFHSSVVRGIFPKTVTCGGLAEHSGCLY